MKQHTTPVRTTDLLGQVVSRAAAIAKSKSPLPAAIVHPCQEEPLRGALAAVHAGLIGAVIVAPRRRIVALASSLSLDLSGIEIVDVPHSHAAADRAVELAHSGQVKALIKGSLHTDELMSAVLRDSSGLRTARWVSHSFVLDVASYHKLLLVTDGAINIRPDLDQKADIVRNAIELARSLGIARPKVAILAAVETVSSKLAATLDAAALCKMSERRQIEGAILDGPLAFDNAISAEAARVKDLRSPVSGDADILMVPDLEAGNLVAKQMEYLAGARSAGIVLGARIPIMLNSRADPAEALIASCALALLLIDHQERAR